MAGSVCIEALNSHWQDSTAQYPVKQETVILLGDRMQQNLYEMFLEIVCVTKSHPQNCKRDAEGSNHDYIRNMLAYTYVYSYEQSIQPKEWSEQGAILESTLHQMISIEGHALKSRGTPKKIDYWFSSCIVYFLC